MEKDKDKKEKEKEEERIKRRRRRHKDKSHVDNESHSESEEDGVKYRSSHRRSKEKDRDKKSHKRRSREHSRERSKSKKRSRSEKRSKSKHKHRRRRSHSSSTYSSDSSNICSASGDDLSDDVGSFDGSKVRKSKRERTSKRERSRRHSREKDRDKDRDRSSSHRKHSKRKRDKDRDRSHDEPSKHLKRLPPSSSSLSSPPPNRDFVEALLSLLQHHPKLSLDLPYLLVQLAGGRSFDLSQMSDPTASHALANVFASLSKFGVTRTDHDTITATTAGNWIWKDDSNTSTTTNQKELVLVKVARFLLNEVGVTMDAVNDFERSSAEQCPSSSSPTDNHNHNVNHSNQNNQQRQKDEEDELKLLTQALLKAFPAPSTESNSSSSSSSSSSLARELCDIVNLVLDGQSICLDGIPQPKLRYAIQQLFSVAGLVQVEMEDDDDDEDEDDNDGEEEDKDGEDNGHNEDKTITDETTNHTTSNTNHNSEKDASFKEKEQTQPQPVFGYALPEESESEALNHTDNDNNKNNNDSENKLTSSSPMVLAKTNLHSILIACRDYQQEKVRAAKSANGTKRVLGPAMPPPLHTTATLTKDNHLYENDDDDDDDDGPAPAGSLAAKQRQMKTPTVRLSKNTTTSNSQQTNDSNQPQREEWMMQPGEHDFLQGIMAKGTIQNRKFKNEKNRSSAAATTNEAPLDPKVKAEIDAILEAHSQARGPSLIEQHRLKIAEEKAERDRKGGGEFNWSRDKDLDGGRRVDKQHLHMVLGGAKSELKTKFQGGLSRGFM